MITSITDMATNRWTYEYDAVYRLTREVLNGTNSTLWEYDEIGNRLTQTGGSGTRSSSYNADNEIAWISDDPSAQLTVTGAVEPGPASNKWYNTWATVKGQTARVSTNDGTFAVPGIPVTEGSNTLAVTVRDVTGNMATQNVTFTKNAVTKTETFGYDCNGNLTAVTSATAVVQYTYDRENRLIQVSSNGAPILECWYDGIGRRIAKREVVDGVTNESLYVYDGWDVLAVLNGQGSLREVYTRGLGLAGDIGTIVAETKFSNDVSTNTYYYHNNHRGDVTTIRSTNGITVATFDYRPYGELRAAIGAISARFRFSSKEYDESTGFYHFGYRQYSPSLGRWLSPDPIGLAGGLNLYEYCGSDSINNVDPLGLWAWDNDWIQIGVGGLLGFYGKDVASSWMAVEQGAYATIDGLIPFVDPFSKQYDECNQTLQTSKTLGKVSQGLLVSAIPFRPFTAPVQQITHWGPSSPWVMTGGASARNWIMSGASHLPRNVETTIVAGSALRYPSGWQWFKGLLGQRIYTP